MKFRHAWENEFIPGFLSGSLSIKGPATNRSTIKLSHLHSVCGTLWFHHDPQGLIGAHFSLCRNFTSNNCPLLLGLMMSFHSGTILWLNKVGKRFVIIIPPTQVKLASSTVKGPRNQSFFNVFLEIQVVGDKNVNGYFNYEWDIFLLEELSQVTSMKGQAFGIILWSDLALLIQALTYCSRIPYTQSDLSSLGPHRTGLDLGGRLWGHLGWILIAIVKVNSAFWEKISR
jgi:hypothetical protein